jgi:hypothetical protein
MSLFFSTKKDLQERLNNALDRISELEWREVALQPTHQEGDLGGRVFVLSDAGQITLRQVSSWPWVPDFRTNAIVTHWRPAALPKPPQHPVIFAGREEFECYARSQGLRLSASLLHTSEYDRVETQAAWQAWNAAKHP